MCNVSQGIADKAFEAGISQGISQGLSQGISQGISQGKLEAYLELLRDGVLSITDVAKKLCISEQAIQEMLK